MVILVQKSYRKNILRDLRGNLSRFLSLFGIVALGVMILTGLASFAPSMRIAGQKYYVQQNVFDLRVLSTLGLSEDDIDAIAATEGVTAVQPVKYLDAEGRWSSTDQPAVLRIQQLPADPDADTAENMNRPLLLAGRMPEAADECVVHVMGHGEEIPIGTTLTLPDGTELAVTDVHEQDGILWHSVPSLPDTAVPGITVEEAIDWDWRFDKMQQHTGEHILSGILHRMFGAENVGFHIGAEAVRMDTSVPISAEGLRAAELEANRIVWQDVPVVITYPTPQELAALTYRSKKEIEGQVRIVTIPGADVCACCGTHTRTTGQVGQIKILASENYKGGVRLSVVCGQRALAEAQAMRARQADIGALLSAKSTETANAVHRVYEEYTALKFAHFGLCSQLFDTMAQLVTPGEDAIRIVNGLDPDGLHRLAVRLSEATSGLCAALTPTDKGTGYCLAQADGDVRALTKALNTALNGRGGGKPGICQGSCAATPEQVEDFLKENIDHENAL